MDSLKSKVVLMYSGGLDSTYVADCLLQEYDEVILMTYVVPFMYGIKRTYLNAAILKEKYGADRVKHKIINIQKQILQIRGDVFAVIKDCFKYKFCKTLCVGCKVTMHAYTIFYCLKNNINIVADGNNKAESTHALEQLPLAVNLFNDFYKNFGIEYVCPIYEKAELKKQSLFMSFLDKLCLVNRRNQEKMELKEKGYKLGIPIGDMHRSIQPQCWMNPFFGLTSSIVGNDIEGLTKYIKDKLSVAKRLLKNDVFK